VVGRRPDHRAAAFRRDPGRRRDRAFWGFVWEWLREHRHRAAGKTNHREAKKLEREVETLRGKKNEGRDEILALVEDAEAAR
jgi:hypothetical protein